MDYPGFDEKTRLIIVSNRIPYNITRINNEISYKKSVGGLVTALDPILKKTGGLWIGWSGLSGNSKFIEKKISISGDNNESYNLKLVNLSHNEILDYYKGFSNRTIWPLFHGFIFQSYFNSAYWKSYQKTNRKFANEVFSEVTAEDIIWVHDYHLALVPGLLRNKNDKFKILYFLHIPFPNFETFRVLPWASKILEGILGSNVVGFQTRRDAINFIACCKEILGLEVDFYKFIVIFQNRFIHVINLPISIDYKHFSSFANKKETTDLENKIRKSLRNIRIVLSVERLDYTKGIKERLRAIDYFFETYPEYKRKIIFLQIAVPSRSKVEEYITFKKEIDELVGKINGKYSIEMWSPVTYTYKSLSQEKLIAYYKVSDICLITSLRDGMNLIAKEYVTCKIGGSGVLILSKFAGAVEEMKERSVLVNPYDIEEIANKIKLALEFDEKEKVQNMLALQEQVKQNDVFKWCKNLLNYFYLNQI
ncbi:MAG: alpha,alpha-trehalose-phosphate synthase (UDP-forming) [Candidatus Humimicrobiaceae bacterium]